jgi:hypothetical protein
LHCRGIDVSRRIAEYGRTDDFCYHVAKSPGHLRDLVRLDAPHPQRRATTASPTPSLAWGARLAGVEPAQAVKDILV